MQLLLVLIAIVLGIAALAFVLYPFYERKVGRRDKQEMPMLQTEKRAGGVDAQMDMPQTSTILEAALVEREQGARSALQEIELDYQLGNISEIDYGVLRERYMRRALLALKSRYDREQEVDEAIEMKLQQMRENDGNAK